MQRRLIITCLCLISFSLGACSLIHPYQPDIQQGNILSASQLDRLRLGMSKDQVAGLLGTPVLVSTFNDNHWAYVYTFQHNGGPITRRQMDLYFSNGRLARIDGDYRSQTAVK